MTSICLYCNQKTEHLYKSYFGTDDFVRTYSCKECDVSYTLCFEDEIWVVKSLYFNINRMTFQFHFPELTAELHKHKLNGNMAAGPMTMEKVTLMTMPVNNLIYLPLQKLKDKITKLIAFI